MYYYTIAFVVYSNQCNVYVLIYTLRILSPWAM